MTATLRWALAGSSIVLLAVLGLIGEQARNLATLAMPKCAAAAAAVPAATRVAFDLFAVNGGHVFLALTPFMLAMGAIAALSGAAIPAAITLSRFALAWLVALAAFGLFLWAMLLPFQTGCADLDDKPVASFVLALDAFLIVAAVLAYRRSIGRRKP